MVEYQYSTFLFLVVYIKALNTKNNYHSYVLALEDTKWISKNLLLCYWK